MRMAMVPPVMPAPTNVTFLRIAVSFGAAGWPASRAEPRGLRPRLPPALVELPDALPRRQPRLAGSHHQGHVPPHRAPVVELLEELHRRQRRLVGSDQQRGGARHRARLDGTYAHVLDGRREARELLVVVELGAVRESPRPGKNRGDGVRRGLLAPLV